MARILIVEPDQNLARTMQKYFADRTYQVSIATNAQAAIITADRSKPDVVILELAIPEHNGLAFLQEFRTYSDWMGIPVVVYSQIPLEDTGLSMQDWKKQGVEAYLYKPTGTLANLLKCIEQRLNNYEAV